MSGWEENLNALSADRMSQRPSNDKLVCSLIILCNKYQGICESFDNENDRDEDSYEFPF